MTREVWITGIGLTSSLGEGLDAHWQALAETAEPKPVVDTTASPPYAGPPTWCRSIRQADPQRGPTSAR